MNIHYEKEIYLWGDFPRWRLTQVEGFGLRVGAATPRLIGAAAPMPMSQYPLDGGEPGFRVTHTERGHLVGLQFAGHEDPGNLVPMYAGFNGGSGSWGQLEARMARHLAFGGDALSLHVRISYPNNETPIPASFLVEVRGMGMRPLPEDLRRQTLLAHVPPAMHFEDVSEADLSLRDELIQAQRRMVGLRWLIEDDPRATPTGSGRVSRSAPLGRAIGLSVGELDTATLKATEQGWVILYATRPYAVLDFLHMNEPALYARLGFPPVGQIDNTSPFGEGQREAIKKINVLFNLGYMRSDLAFSDFEPWDLLMPGSSDASPQVDHINGRAGSGSNAYSNARLVSKMMNLALNRAEVRASVIAFYNNPLNWGPLFERLRGIYG